MRAGTHGLCLVLVVAMGMAGLLPAGCTPSAARARGEAATLAVAPVVLADNGMEVLWQTSMLLDPGTQLTGVWLCGDFLVGLGSGNRLYAANAATGVRLWSDQAAEPHETVWPPAVYKTDLWVATTTRLIGYQGYDGKRMGMGLRDTDGRLLPAADPSQRGSKGDSLPLDFAPAGRPVTNGAHVFIPDGKGWLQAVSITPRVVSWGRWTEDVVSAGPAVDSALVYFGGRNGMVYASMQNIRRVVWDHQTEGGIVADLKRTDSGLVLAASLDYTLYAFQGTSGALRWRYNAGERIRRTPYAIGAQVFLFTAQAGLVALDETNGRAVWRLAEGDDIFGADADTVYVRSRGNDLLAVNRADGKVRFGVPMRRGTLVVANETGNGILYLVQPNGQILATAKKQEAKPAAEGEKPAAEGEKPAPGKPAPATPAAEAPAAEKPAAETPAAETPAAETPAVKAPAAKAPAAKKVPATKVPAAEAPAEGAAPAATE